MSFVQASNALPANSTLQVGNARDLKIFPPVPRHSSSQTFPSVAVQSNREANVPNRSLEQRSADSHTGDPKGTEGSSLLYPSQLVSKQAQLQHDHQRLLVMSHVIRSNAETLLAPLRTIKIG